MLILMHKENEQDQAHIFQDIFRKFSNISVDNDHFENIKHDNLLNFLF